MLIKPPKINPLENEIEVARKNTYKQSESFLGLLDLFLRIGVYGSHVKLRPDIAGEIYSYIAPSPRMGKSTLPKPKQLVREDSDTKGKNRIGNIYDHRRQITPAEAKHFHYYFTKAFGESWGSIISEKELVTRTITENINKGLQAGLSWPIDLPAAYGIQSLFQANNNYVLGVRFVDVPKESSRAAGNSANYDRNNKAYPKDSRPVHSVRWKFLVNVTGIKNENVFVFETYDSEVEYTDGTEIGQLFNVFPQNLVQTTKSETNVPTFHGNPFIVLKIFGGFIMHALTFPLDWDFQERFGVNPRPNLDHWTQEEGRLFLSYVQRWLNHEPDALQLASYAYRVE